MEEPRLMTCGPRGVHDEDEWWPGGTHHSCERFGCDPAPDEDEEG